MKVLRTLICFGLLYNGTLGMMFASQPMAPIGQSEKKSKRTFERLRNTWPRVLKEFFESVTIMDITRSTTPAALRPEGESVFIRFIDNGINLKQLKSRLLKAGYKRFELDLYGGDSYESKTMWVAMWTEVDASNRSRMSYLSKEFRGVGPEEILEELHDWRKHSGKKGRKLFALEYVLNPRN